MKYIKIIVLLITISTSHFTIAQAVGTPYIPNIHIPFSFLYGGGTMDRLNSAKQTSDGGYIAVGMSQSSASGDVTGTNHGKHDAWIIKYNAYGKIEWQRLYGGNEYEEAYSVIQTSDGGYLVSGHSNSSANGDVTGTSHGQYDFWLLKLSATGNIQWQRLYGGAGNEMYASILEASDGGYILMGQSSYSGGTGDVTVSNGNYAQDCWIVKINTTGNIQWQKLYGKTTSSSYAQSIQPTADGGYILSGMNYGPTNSLDFWIFKINATGVLQWERIYGGTGHEEAQTAIQTSDGGYIVSGYSSNSTTSGDVTGTNNGMQDIWILKLNAAGAIQWQRLYGGSKHDTCYSIVQNADGGYTLFGNTASSNSGTITATGNGGSDLLIMKLNSSGAILSQQVYGGSAGDVGKSISKTTDGGYIISGYSESSNSGNIMDTNNGYYQDCWLIKIDASGNIANVPNVGQK